METQPSAQSSFQKLNVDNSCQKTCKIIYYIFEVLSNFTVFLYFLPNILSRIVGLRPRLLPSTKLKPSPKIFHEPVQYAFLQQSFVIFTQKQKLKYSMVPNTKCMSLPSTNRIMDASSWLCYHIKLPDSQLPNKALTYFNATNISIVEYRI